MPYFPLFSRYDNDIMLSYIYSIQKIEHKDTLKS